MVRVKLSATFILATAVIAPIVALPTVFRRSTNQNESVFMSILVCLMIVFDLSLVSIIQDSD